MIFSVKYVHLDRIYVKRGDKIKAGDEVATVGNTGMSTGPHLHFEVEYLDTLQNPLTFY
jgi:murein DD-endopeptidase